MVGHRDVPASSGAAPALAASAARPRALVRRSTSRPASRRIGRVALLLEPQRELLAARLDDAALGQHVDDVGLDVVEQALVVGDEQHAQVRAELRVDALGDDAQGVDVEARVGLVEDRELGLEDGHLEHLQALLLAAREALVDVAARRTRRPA